jgi:hypothetical protein
LKASCDSCAKITGKLETYLCEHNFNAIRFHHGYPRARGKSRKGRPSLKVLVGETPHSAPARKLPDSIAPGISLLPIFPPPGICLGRPASNRIPILNWQLYDTSGDGAQRTRRLKADGLKGALAYAQINPGDFMRVLAKIAHGYAVFNVGLDGFRPLLAPLITGKDVSIASFYVGGYVANGPILSVRDDSTYQIVPFQATYQGELYLVAHIRLFANLRPPTPVYAVIFGQPLSNAT